MDSNGRRSFARWAARQVYDFALPLALIAGVLTVHIYFGIVVSRLPDYQISSRDLEKLGVRSDPISTLDEGAMKKIGQKIEQDPGVKKVALVRRKFPAGFEARVQPRAPWIAVRAAGSLVQTDQDLVRLEGEFRRPPPSRTGLVITGVVGPAPEVGRAWDDEEMRVARAVARLVTSTPELRNLVCEIDMANFQGRISAADSEIVLVARSGCRILWGHAPCFSDGFEPTVSEKLQNLSMTLKTFPSLAGLDYAKIYIRNRPTVRRSKPAPAANQS